MKTKRLPIWIFPILMLVMIALVAIMPKSQDTRRGAYFAGTSLFLNPDNVGEKAIGEEFPVQLMVQTQNMVGTSIPAKVDFVETTLCYEPTKVSIEGDSLAVGNTVADLSGSAGLSVGVSLPSIVLADVAVVQSQKCLHLVVKSERPNERLGSGLVHVVTVKFKGLIAGSGTISLLKDVSKVAGYNPEGSDLAMEVASATGTNYVIKAGEAATVWPVLNYRVAFAGVRPTTETACANWQLSVVVKKGELAKTYTSTPVADGSVAAVAGGQLRAFKGSVELRDFNEVSGVAVFVKGPRHLQTKYGVNNQTAFYNRAGGEVTLTTSSATSPVYDWTGYPIMACDIVGDSATTAPNGVCNASDYSVVKKAASETKVVADGGSLLEDLDGNCKTNVADLNLLMQTLKERQEQLY
ncbi:MAG: hypothetical protein WCV93_03815 [Candidatus Shapirobacteria bacterium]